MRNMTKNIVLTVIFTISLFALQGCSSGLDPDTFSVELSERGYSRSSPMIIIRSNDAEPIEVTNIIVNKGQCNYYGVNQQLNFPLHFKMGLIARLGLRQCSFINVVQVDIETNRGNVSYQFN